MRSRGQQPQAGFTLIELLMVIFIVAVVASFATLSVGNISNERVLKTEIQRFAALVAALQDEAYLQGREYGVELMNGGYRFIEFDPFSEQWVAIADDDMMRLRTLPEGLEIELFIEDKRVLLSDDQADLEVPDEDSNEASDYQPHLYVYSSGEHSPFELHIVRPFDDARTIVRGDVIGNIEFGPEDDS